MAMKSKVEISEHREEIDDLLLEGKSSRFVSEYLKNQYNETISYGSINNYKKNKLNVEKEVSIKYQAKKSEEKKEKRVNRTVSDIDKLDKLIDEGIGLKVDIEDLKYCDEYDPVKVANLKIRYKKLALDAVKVKNDILKNDDGVGSETNIHINFDSKLDRLKRIEENVGK